jgi:hypothetical protein
MISISYESKRPLDAKKMVKGPKILHCEFMAKRLSYIGEESWRG